LLKPATAVSVFRYLEERPTSSKCRNNQTLLIKWWLTIIASCRFPALGLSREGEGSGCW